MKGEFYRLFQLSLENHVQKSQGRVTAALERAGLLEFARQSFLSSAFYDVLPFPRLVMAVAEARERDVRELTSAMGRAAAEFQMNGVYGYFLKALKPENFDQRVAQVVSHFYDFGPVQVTPVAGGAEIHRSEVPLCVAEWWSLVHTPFVVLPLEANGARDVTVTWQLEPKGARSGVPCGDVAMRVRWRVD